MVKIYIGYRCHLRRKAFGVLQHKTTYFNNLDALSALHNRPRQRVPNITASNGFVLGLQKMRKKATTAASELTDAIKNSMLLDDAGFTENETNVKVNVETDTEKLETFKTAVSGIVSTVKTTIKTLPSIFGDTFTETEAIANNCNLYSVGANIISSLNSGICSMYGTVTDTAQSIAESVAATIGREQDFNILLSGIIDKSSNFVLDTQKMREKATATEGLNTTVETTLKPTVNAYTPSASSVNNTTTNRSTTNNFNPQFTLNLNGASATESNKRKVKQWVKESIEETFESMSRTNPELCEV